MARRSEGANGALALVSGRPLQELDFLFAPLRLPAIGGHGAEIRLSATNVMNGPPPISLDRELKQRLREIAVKYPGVTIEDKGYSLALHYRLAPQLGGDVVRTVAAICEKWGCDGVEILPGKSVIEIKPRRASTRARGCAS